MNYRYKSAEEYLRVLEASLRIGWQASYEAAKTGAICQRLALLHPDHYSELNLPASRTVETLQRSIQGPRTFAAYSQPGTCQSPLVWGYQCELGGDKQQDHLFPYSLGGPSIPTNRIYLCRYHNMVKTADVHCYPWEDLERWALPWLDQQIRRMRIEIFDIYA